jgi:hypothetical protein
VGRHSFQGQHEEVSMRAGLNANATHHLTLSGARLIFQKEVVLE